MASKFFTVEHTWRELDAKVIWEVLLAYVLAKVRGMTPTIMLVLSGVVVSSIFNAGVSIMKYLADPENDLPAITFWLMGSLSGMRWDNLAFATPIILTGLVVVMIVSWRLNLLTMGDSEARSLGVNTQRTRMVAIICATAMTATAVSQSGAIGWVGLSIPIALVGAPFFAVLLRRSKGVWIR